MGETGLSPFLDQVIAVNYTVTLLVAILFFRLGQALAEKTLYWIGLGWVLLFASSLSLLFSARLDLLAAVALVYAAQTASASSNRTSRTESRLLLLFVTATAVFLPLSLTSILPPGIDAVARGAVLGLALLSTGRVIKTAEHSSNLATISNSAYAILLFAAAPFQVSLADRDVQGFLFMGASALKILLLLGLIEILVSSSARSRDAQARAREERATISRIMHEVGTPLAILRMTAESILEDRGLGAQVREEVVQVRDSATHLHAILGAWSEFPQSIDQSITERSEIGRETTHRPENLNTIVQAAILSLKYSRDENVIFAVRFSSQAVICCLKGQIIQVIANILRNSYDAFRDGEGRIVVQTGLVSIKQQTWVELKIRDDGEGIAPADLDRIYDDAFSSRGYGRGLGLGIAKHLVLGNNGQIAFASPPEGSPVGTEVTILFPQHDPRCQA